MKRSATWLAAVHVAEAVGLDFFGFGEHHTRSMPLSSPTSLVNAAASVHPRHRARHHGHGAVHHEPIRFYEQLATAAAIAPGRIEVVTGGGSTSITFPIFDTTSGDYDVLYRSKLEPLLEINHHDRVTWSGPIGSGHSTTRSWCPARTRPCASGSAPAAAPSSSSCASSACRCSSASWAAPPNTGPSYFDLKKSGELGADGR